MNSGRDERFDSFRGPRGVGKSSGRRVEGEPRAGEDSYLAEGTRPVAEGKADVEIFERVKRKIERLRSQALIDELTNRTIGVTWPNR